MSGFRVAAGGIALAMSLAGCGADPTLEPLPKPAPEYDRETGRLKKLTADSDGDGKVDTWAFMDGLLTSRIEIDRDRDGAPDRVEFYEPRTSAGAGAPSQIARAEDRSGPDRAVIRRETYLQGLLSRVEEDTNADGRLDKWEDYIAGALLRVDLDLDGRGFPTRRLIYTGNGAVHVEVDPDGDGRFEPESRGK
jgi:hypothetical protein